LLKLTKVQQFCRNKTLFILVTWRVAAWPHQKLNVVQLQEKQHVLVKEMQLQKLQLEKELQQDVNVVHLQREAQLDEDQLEEKLVREELPVDPEEEDDSLPLYFF
jgi:hypothetical protein